jgi:hypothetical protein
MPSAERVGETGFGLSAAVQAKINTVLKGAASAERKRVLDNLG